MNNIQENTTVKEGTADQENTVGNSGSGKTVNVNVVNEKTLKWCFNEWIDTEWVILMTRSKTRFKT